MIKTMKSGITHKGKICRAGELLSLPAQEEERLVREGWATFAEAWPAAQDTPNTSAPEDEPKTDAPEDEPKTDAPEDEPKTDAPEELEPKRPRSRRK